MPNTSFQYADVPQTLPTAGQGFNVAGKRRAGISAADRLIIKRGFGTLFRSGLNISKAVEKIKREDQSPLTQEICEFIESSKRGICGFRAVEDV